MILLGIILLIVLFWTSREILQLRWQPCLKSIGNTFIWFFLFLPFIWLLFFKFIFIFILLEWTKNLMYLQILFISFSTFKALLGNHFHILKNLSPNKTLLLLTPNKIPNTKFGSLWLLRLLMDLYTRLFCLKYQFFLHNFFSSCMFPLFLFFIWISTIISFYCILFFYYVYCSKTL